MANRFKADWQLLAAELQTRVPIIKIKINGLCTNRCVFCPFHSDPKKLEVEDLARFFDLIERPTYRRIDISGGEPTLHPRFREICGFLRDRFKDRIALHLGTNLIPIARKDTRWSRVRHEVLSTFDMISVGCDDEHKNIHLLEELAPVIVDKGIHLAVNVMNDYCSESILSRVLTLKRAFGIRVSYSDVHHFYENRSVVNPAVIPCRRQVHEFMLNCNGDGFFCFHQEYEEPLFNLHTVRKEELNYFLSEYVPDPYRFCGACPLYRPKPGPALRARIQRGLSRIGVSA